MSACRTVDVYLMRCMLVVVEVVIILQVLPPLQEAHTRFEEVRPVAFAADADHPSQTVLVQPKLPQQTRLVHRLSTQVVVAVLMSLFVIHINYLIAYCSILNLKNNYYVLLHSEFLTIVVLNKVPLNQSLSLVVQATHLLIDDVSLIFLHCC